MKKLFLPLFAAAALHATVLAAPDRPDQARYREVVRQTAAMVSDSVIQQSAQSHGLQVLNLTWEDTGRYQNSSVGPNISDMTLQVQVQDPHTQQYELTCLPVIRFPNFSDKTSDLKLRDFQLLVGNEKGAPLHKVSLEEYLGHFRRYLSKPSSWKGQRESLLAKRDSHALVSAQACFLPIPKHGEAEFNPVLFNYQSYKDNPAVLTILATREGTSATIIDNARDGFAAGRTWGQRLFFNQDGERASLSGKRLSDFLASAGEREVSASVGDHKGLNMVLLVQVPLKQKVQPMRACALPCPPPGMSMGACKDKKSDVEAAVVGHGKVEGPFTEVDNLAIERDERFPVRVTVQFYKATSNGAVSGKDMAEIAAQINQVYADGDYVGSLVTGGETGRPTEYAGNKTMPHDWWSQFWNHYHRHIDPKGDVLDYFRPRP